MKPIFNAITIVSSVLMIISVLIQQRGSGLGASFGGDSNVYHSRRGAEKVVFQATIVFAIVFVMSVVLGILSR